MAGNSDLGGLNHCSSGDACTQGQNAVKFIVDASLQFGDGWATAGPLLSFEFRRGISGTQTTSSSEGSSTTNEQLRLNSVNLGGRAKFRLGHSSWRFILDGGINLDSITYTSVYSSTSGSSTSSSKYVDAYTYHAPFFGAGFERMFTDNFGVVVLYHHSPVRPSSSTYISDGSSSKYSNFFHDNDAAAGIVIYIGGPKKK